MSVGERAADAMRDAIAAKIVTKCCRYAFEPRLRARAPSGRDPATVRRRERSPASDVTAPFEDLTPNLTRVSVRDASASDAHPTLIRRVVPPITQNRPPGAVHRPGPRRAAGRRAAGRAGDRGARRDGGAANVREEGRRPVAEAKADASPPPPHEVRARASERSGAGSRRTRKHGPGRGPRTPRPRRLRARAHRRSPLRAPRRHVAREERGTRPSPGRRARGRPGVRAAPREDSRPNAPPRRRKPRRSGAQPHHASPERCLASDPRAVSTSARRWIRARRVPQRRRATSYRGRTQRPRSRASTPPPP